MNTVTILQMAILVMLTYSVFIYLKPVPMTVYYDPVDDSSVTATGQINLSTTFGQKLYEVASLNHVNRVLEIGTFTGGGSTLCLAKGLNQHRNSITRLVTIENDKGRWQTAKEALRVYPYINLLHGAIVGAEEIGTKQEVAEFGIEDKAWPEWWEGEYEATLAAPHLENPCGEINFDLILFDGGEFYGDAEFSYLFNGCRHPMYIALHDTNTFKNSETRKQLIQSQEYEFFADDRTGAGWSIFSKRI